jgi:hypothetical protein
MKTNKIKLSEILSISFGIFLASMIFYSFYSGCQLKKNGITIDGKIIKIEHEGYSKFGGQGLLHYEFSYNGKNYHKSANGSGFLVVYKEKFTNKIFPVIFNPKDGTSIMLIFKNDFEEYKLPYPDSLNWIEVYLKKYLDSESLF